MVQDLIPEIKITEQKWQRKAKLENKVINHQKRTHKNKETKKKCSDPNNSQRSCTANARWPARQRDRHTERQTGMCIVVLGGADLTSTSYVYSSLVVHDPGRVAARAPVHPAVLHLGVCDIELADHVSLVGLVVAQVVVAVFDDGVVVQ